MGDVDTNAHLKGCTSVASVDQFMKCIDEKLDTEIFSRSIAAGDYSLLANKTTDMADSFPADKRADTADKDGMSSLN